MSMLDTLLGGVKSVASNNTALPSRPQLAFTGSGVTVVDSSSTGQTLVTITGGDGTAQETNALANGLNSNVLINGESSIRFGSYTGPVILGGISSSVAPLPGQAFDLSFIVQGQQVTIRNLDASSSSNNQIVTGTGLDVVLPKGQTPQCRLVWDATLSKFILQTTGIIQTPFYNVLDFGFDSTGSTPNDSAMIVLQSSVTTRGAGTIFFPAGYYLFNDTITAFPPGCNIQGEGAANTANLSGMTFLEFGGTGTFFQAAQQQQFDSLTFYAVTNNSFSTAPAQENVIVGLSSGALSTFEVATAQPHGYTSGDLIHIYGVGIASGINTDPGWNAIQAGPWTIAVADSTHFRLVGSTYASGFSNVSVNVTGAANVGGSIELTCSGGHGLLNDQVVYVSGVGGVTIPAGIAGKAGLFRVTVISPTVVKLYVDWLTGSGVLTETYTTGGTIQSGGVCISASNNAQVGLNIQGAGPTNGPGNVIVRNCQFGGFKYGISVDNAELCWIEKCNFQIFQSNKGYSRALMNDNRTHSAYGIRIGAFNNEATATANMATVDQCNFTYCFGGILHHDGTMHHVMRCNYENFVVATLMIPNGVYYDGIQNDGTTKDCFQVGSDYAAGFVSNVSIKNAQLSGSQALINELLPINYTTFRGSIDGLILENNAWYGSQPPLNGNVNFTIGPVFAVGNVCPNAASLSTFAYLNTPNAFSAPSATDLVLLDRVRTVTATTNIDSGQVAPDYLVLCNQSSAISIFLPSTSIGRVIKIKDVSGAASAHNVTVGPFSVGTLIDGASSYVISVNYGGVELTCDGTNWWITNVLNYGS